MSWNLREFADDASLVCELSLYIRQCLQQGISERGVATLAVSGGSTPIALFRQLALEAMDWSRIQITLVDERWVPCAHPDSNAGLVKQTLIDAIDNDADKPGFVSLTNGDATPFSAEEDIDRRLQAMPWPLDVVVLGMGTDGHTASLFPGADGLGNAIKGLDAKGSKPSRCCAITPPTASHARMTLTVPALQDSRHQILHIRGRDKRLVLEQAMQPGPVEQYPIRAFLHQNQNTLEIFSAEQ